ncbi:MAG: LysM peptidoglycan-binding domain-containing protein [Parvularculaceae bacterium]|nr:LysM peptidoglycan-binding domain-containing protein [Parvularculaceae bacterium]
MKGRRSFRATALAATALTVIAPCAIAQTTDQPAGETRLAPKPTLEEELVRIRDMMAVQSMRLEEAEQTIKRLNGLVGQQAARIGTLETELGMKKAAAIAPSVSAGHGVYVVQAGETLYRIALNNGVSVERLMRENRIRTPQSLKAGQTLIIPGASGGSTTIVATEPPPPTPSFSPPPAERRVASAIAAAPPPGSAQGPETPSATPEEVGVRPEEGLNEPYLALASDVGGILTPRGTLFFEPELDYSHSSENRFFFSGTEIIDAILIGVIEATDTDRMSLVARGGLRYGLTDRLELDGKVPFVYRDDRVSGVALDDGTEFVRDQRGAGLGDIEVGLHYQLTDGVGFPYAVANLRAKAPTGEGPFDVDRNAAGVELDAATGSGFWTVEPSITAILPTDPAVFYANLGYQMNFAVSPDERVGAALVREYDPGDAIRASLGVGLALNERLSLNFGYDQSQFFRTSLLIETIDTTSGAVLLTRARQPRVTVGSFGIGGSYFVNDRLRLTLNTSIGATDEAPDMRLILRAQMKLAD